MYEATRKRMDRAIRIERLKKVGMVLGVLAVVAGGFWLTGLDASVETRRVAGVVKEIGPLNTNNTKAVEEGLAVDVTLDDGRTAHVMVLKTRDPHVGDHVEVTEHIHGTGRSTFSWK